MFKRRACTDGHIILGLVLTFASGSLLLLAALSVLVIRALPVLTTSHPEASYGTLGWCAAECALWGAKRVPDVSEFVPWLTKAAFLVPAAAGLQLVAFVVLVLHTTERPICDNHLWFRIPVFLGAVAGVLACAATVALHAIAYRRFKAGGADPHLGAALWITIAGAVVGVAAFFLGGPPYGGRFMYRASKTSAYNV